MFLLRKPSPSLIRADVREEMMRLAGRVLAPQFAEAIGHSKLIFFQPIVDLESPRLVFGRVVVIGDAAFVARPHVAMGVPKAAGDALALVRAIQQGGTEYLSGLRAFEAERLRVSRNIVARGRYLGSTWKPAQIRRGKRQAQGFLDWRAGARDDGDSGPGGTTAAEGK
jgi:2-polyprenyl-6-methoxyphenol hydroxylase-like FAD-dependent oxidoreductase